MHESMKKDSGIVKKACAFEVGKASFYRIAFFFNNGQSMHVFILTKV